MFAAPIEELPPTWPHQSFPLAQRESRHHILHCTCSQPGSNFMIFIFTFTTTATILISRWWLRLVFMKSFKLLRSNSECFLLQSEEGSRCLSKELLNTSLASASTCRTNAEKLLQLLQMSFEAGRPREEPQMLCFVLRGMGERCLVDQLGGFAEGSTEANPFWKLCIGLTIIIAVMDEA